MEKNRGWVVKLLIEILDIEENFLFNSTIHRRKAWPWKMYSVTIVFRNTRNSTQLYTSIYATRYAEKKISRVSFMVYRAASFSKNGGGRRGVPIIPRAENRSSLNAERERISNSEVPLTLNPEDLLSLVFYHSRVSPA